ncbi:MAG: protein-methionine-sulfoxide reductase catalytic subunit MsrP [Gammaproteobacteria bacterium]|nr:protein-methionine-sulfoxide reductase catalytic subunit MsrP [Gammaproteobacteria bacterium]
MLIKKPQDISSSEITDYAVYQQRRKFMTSSFGLAAATFLPWRAAVAGYGGKALNFSKSNKFAIPDELTSFDDITHYNNFYEFGTDKYSPAKNAQALTTDPWSVRIEGEVEKPVTLHLEDILKQHTLEERIYRLRCVERWSMVIPWIGFPLADLIKKVKPTSKAKYVVFETLKRPGEMNGQHRNVLDWPYVEGLRMDEAMNPLTILAVGLYGEVMPKQNGAPIRLVVPWKYGFKSIKSVVKISFTEKEPVSSWTRVAPSEYGFYSNVNPEVDHPRWSQRKERRIGEFLKRNTLPFNGYADQVASLYAGMDLKKYY